MPPKGKGKKKKGKGKKGKGKKGKKIVPEPPPLHSLTVLYNLLVEKIRQLDQMRIQARKKRLEAWFMTREMSHAKSDAQIYHDHLDDQINELHELIQNIMEELEKEKAEIQKEIDRLLAELNKRHEEIIKRTLEIEEQLSRIKAELMQFEPLMAKLAKLLLRLEQLAKEIAAAELEADIKTRHLKNQFLCERGKLHNHLEKQLYDLIQNCRSYIMPILWHHMRRMGFNNSCTRWKLAKADAKNIRLGELREELMLKRKLLTIEKSYLGVDWAFFKLAEIQAERKKKLRDSQQSQRTEAEDVPSELATAFNIYLKKRLTAFQEAKRRDQKLKKLKLKNVDSSALALKKSVQISDEIPGEDHELEEEWEDVEAGEGSGWDPYRPKRHSKHRHRRHKKPKYHSAAGTADGDDDEDLEDVDDIEEDNKQRERNGSQSQLGSSSSSGSSYASSATDANDNESEGNGSISSSEEGENWEKLTTVTKSVPSKASGLSVNSSNKITS